MQRYVFYCSRVQVLVQQQVGKLRTSVCCVCVFVCVCVCMCVCLSRGCEAMARPEERDGGRGCCNWRHLCSLTHRHSVRCVRVALYPYRNYNRDKKSLRLKEEWQIYWQRKFYWCLWKHPMLLNLILSSLAWQEMRSGGLFNFLKDTLMLLLIDQDESFT